MREILEKLIDFSKAENFNISDFVVEVKNAAIDSKTNVLSLVLELNFMLSAETAERFKSALKRSLGDVKDIDLTLLYKDVKGSEIPAPDPKKVEERKAAAAAKGGSWQGGWQGGGKPGRRKNGYVPVTGNLIMGKHVTGEPVDIGTITSESGAVVIEGEIFQKEARTTRNDSKLAIMYITDKKTSICVNCFMDNKKWDDVQEHLTDGTAVRIAGKAEWDEYAHDISVMATSIEKTEKKERMDTYPEKRVELHCHTKMSAMDGLNVATDMVQRAEKWGHKAVAITDHGVVQAFP